MTDTPATSEVVLPDAATLQRLRTALNKGTIDYKALVDDLAPAPEKVVVERVESRVPAPRELTSTDLEALKRLPEVFGSVQPESKRTLTDDEMTALHEERSVLKVVESVTSGRIDDIADVVKNHADLKAEDDFTDEAPRPLLTKDGHWAVKRRFPVSDTDEDFSVEVRKGSATLDPAALKALADDPTFEGFTHADYLAMTEQTRVFDEHKAMLHLKKRPELVEVLARATSRSAPSVSLYPRKRK